MTPVKRENRLVALVCVVCLVYLVEPDELDKPERPDEPDKPPTKRMDCFSVLLVSAGGSVARSMALSGWGCRRRGRGFGGRLRGLFLFEIDDRGGKRPVSCHDGEA